MKEAQEKLKTAKDELKKYNTKSVKATEKLKEARARVEELTAQYGKNSDEVKEAQKEVDKYKNEVSNANKKVKEARERVREHSKAIEENNKKIKEGQKKLNDFGNSAIKSIDKIIAKTVKMGMAFGTSVMSFAGITGFSGAFDMEGYKTQLSTAVKDTKKAGELMANAIQFANRTPFETGEVVEATAKMEAYGLSSKKWLQDVADMAGATNKGIDQATEAMADAVMGEWERLKEFGIKKEMLVAAAAEKYGKNIVFNKKGQVKSQEKLEIILQKVMRDKFAGGAEQQAKTLRGLWSTITGVTKSSLAKIIGMNEDGTIKQGSLYEKLKEKLELVVQLFNKWLEDGTIDKIGEQVTNTVNTMIEVFRQVASFIAKHRTWIETILIFASSIYLTVKAFMVFKTVVTVLTIVIGLLNGTLMLTPLGWIALAIGSVVTAGYLLYKNWEKITAGAKSFWNWLKKLGGGFIDFKNELFSSVDPITTIVEKFTKLKEAAGKAWSYVKNLFGAKDKEISVDIDEEKKTVSKKTEDRSIKYQSNFTVPKTVEKKQSLIQAKNNKKAASSSTEIGIEPKITVIIQGDVYGYDDFNEKVAEAVVKIYDTNRANIAR